MELVKHSQQSPSLFSDGVAFEHGQRIAKALASSDLVPANYRSNIANCLVAVEMAIRVSMSPLMVMQNLHLIEGRPSWSGAFIIAAVNASGRFAPLKFKIERHGKKKLTHTVWEGPKGQRTKKDTVVEIEEITCYAYTKDSDGEPIQGPTVSVSMAVAEGWYFRAGSKWPNMPELMLQYRAASFFGRLYAPEMLMGMKSAEEVSDAIYTEDVEAEVMPNDAPILRTPSVQPRTEAVQPPTVSVQTKTEAVQARTASVQQESTASVLPDDDEEEEGRESVQWI